MPQYIVARSATIFTMVDARGAGEALDREARAQEALGLAAADLPRATAAISLGDPEIVEGPAPILRLLERTA